MFPETLLQLQAHNLLYTKGHGTRTQCVKQEKVLVRYEAYGDAAGVAGGVPQVSFDARPGEPLVREVDVIQHLDVAYTALEGGNKALWRRDALRCRQHLWRWCALNRQHSVPNLLQRW